MRLEGKVALVVGAGQTRGAGIGNGRATAVLFAREGARVFAVDRDEESLQATREQIVTEGGACETLRVDVTREADCEAAANGCVDSYGRIDVLHNNVGVGVGDGDVTEIDKDAWSRIFDTNLRGTALTCKYVLPTMQRAGSGAIVNVSSIAAVSKYSFLAYKTSKAGVNSLTQALACSYAEYGVRVNAIMPGLIDTPVAIEGIRAVRGAPREQIVGERNEQVPLRKRMGTAWDVAHAALFLASDEASFITGVVLPVDGGQTAFVG
jgi:NAD(P)-dependent dehydrogenase (short-subunit alcohol dehydrogenase family)